MIGFLTGFGIEAHIVEREFAEPIEGDALHETRGDDAVGVDVGAGNENGATGNLGDGIEGHGG